MEINGLEEFLVNFNKEHDELGKIINPILENYKLPDKEILEVCQIGKFVYKLDSSIKIIDKPKPPDPDFIITYKDKLVGLEHTRIYSKDAEYYNRIKSLIDYSEKLYRAKYPNEKIHAQISILNDKMDFKKNEKHKLAEEMAEYIYNFSKDFNSLRPTFISKLKTSIHSLVSFTYCEKNWQSPYLTKERLEVEIHKKENNIENYKTGRKDISNYWLVLFIGSLSSVSYQLDKNIDYAMDSKFDRVFLMTDFEAQIIIIK
jgi:hypothetical protein